MKSSNEPMLRLLPIKLHRPGSVRRDPEIVEDGGELAFPINRFACPLCKPGVNTPIQPKRKAALVIGIARIVQENNRKLILQQGKRTPNARLVLQTQAPDDKAIQTAWPIEIGITDDELTFDSVRLAQMEGKVHCVLANIVAWRWHRRDDVNNRFKVHKSKNRSTPGMLNQLLIRTKLRTWSLDQSISIFAFRAFSHSAPIWPLKLKPLPWEKISFNN
ncbi:MAG: hypothetical protein ACLQVY_01235 [Limisphaerales bacterium]